MKEEAGTLYIYNTETKEIVHKANVKNLQATAHRTKIAFKNGNIKYHPGGSWSINTCNKINACNNIGFVYEVTKDERDLLLN